MLDFFGAKLTTGSHVPSAIDLHLSGRGASKGVTLVSVATVDATVVATDVISTVVTPAVAAVVAAVVVPVVASIAAKGEAMASVAALEVGAAAFWDQSKKDLVL